MIRSVAIYAVTFGWSLLLFWLAEGQYSLGKSRLSKSVGHLCALAAGLLLCLLAGLRAGSVGVDTDSYPVSLTADAMGYGNFLEYLAANPGNIADEPLGGFVVWICSRFSAGVQPLLFVYQLLTVGPVFLAAYKMREKLSLTAAMAVYIFFFFNNSLNMMRQSVSCALLLYSLVTWIDKGRLDVKAVLASIAAVLFHRSSLFGLFLLCGVYLLSKLKYKQVQIFLYAVVALSPLMLDTIAGWLLNAGFLDAHMQYYMGVFLDKNVESDWFINPFSTYSLSYILMYSVLVGIAPCSNLQIFSSNKTLSAKFAYSTIYKQVTTFTFVGYFMYLALLFALNSMYGGRISLYFDYFLIIAIALSCKGKDLLIKKGLVFIILVFIWLIWIIVLGWSGSQEYRFFFET